MPIRPGDVILAVNGKPTRKAYELYERGQLDMELSKLIEANHTTTATLRVPGENGETLTEQVKVVYRPITSEVMRELRAIDEDKERGVAHQAALLVKSLPDIVQGDEPVPLSLELFQQMDARYPTVIVEAVLTHFNGRG